MPVNETGETVPPMSKALPIAYVLNHGDSLSQWEQAGLFQRQTMLLREFQRRGMQITIVSFGGSEERAFASKLPGMRILCNWMGLPPKFYARRLHQLFALPLLKPALVLTADAASIVVARRIAWSWQIPLVYRFGFVLSYVHRTTSPDDRPRIKELEGMERVGLESAAHVVTPTREIAEGMIRIEPSVASKVTVIPNFVDTQQFRPLPEEKRYDLVYVGRFSVPKNLFALLAAVERLDLSIAMVGGPLPREIGTPYDLSQKLRQRFGDLDGRIHWLGRLENADLPALYNRARAFIIASRTEGTNRALMEAMACGLPAIVSDVPQLRYMIEHEVNGYLCPPERDGIAAAIETVFSRPELMRKMGAKARKRAEELYALDKLADREARLLRELARRQPMQSAAPRVIKYLLRRR